MKTHFHADEFRDRAARLRAAMTAEGFDGLLCSKPETHFWLTGYDTFGFCFFQCLVVTADGRTALLTRSADLRQAQLTSSIGDVRVWVDGADADPTADLADLLHELGLIGARLGVEWDSHGLTAAAGRKLEARLAGICTLCDASLLVSRLRLVKSPAELAYVRRAAALADDAFEAALALAGPGADEALIHAAMHQAIHQGGGDDPSNPFIIGSGPYALLCRYHTGRRRLDAEDQLTLEWAGTWRHYHAAQMRTVPIGRASDRHRQLFEAAAEALLASEAQLRPGCTIGDVFQAHVRTLDGQGLAAHRLNACGYSLGAVYAPSWMDWPMVYADNPVALEPGMVLFLHMILLDSDTGTAMTLGRTSIVTTAAPEVLSRQPLELIVR
ncbi:MAG: aminopeptidase P family protein [Geminicoccaceae bacterium]|nr:MAG: aminopeptidase P family protein [Geminicoccaceae bacterium]